MNKTKVRKIWHEFNNRIFNGEMTVPRFIKFAGSLDFDFPIDGAYLYGEMFYHKKLNNRTTRATIAHEMIHQYQEEILDIDLTDEKFLAHGKTFAPLGLKFWREYKINVWIRVL